MQFSVVCDVANLLSGHGRTSMGLFVLGAGQREEVRTAELRYPDPSTLGGAQGVASDMKRSVVVEQL